MKSLKLKYQKFIHIYQDEKPTQGYLLFYIVFPLLLVLFAETISSHNLLGGFLFIIQNPIGYLANTSIVITSLTFSMLFHKRLGVHLLITLVWFVLAFINFIVLFFRVTPFTGSDLHLMKDGRDIIAKYLGPIQILTILVLTALVILFVIYFIFITPKAAVITPLKISIPFFFISFALSWILVFGGQHIGVIETEFRELSVSYRKNGFYYCFGASIVDVGIKKPDTYSTDKIEELAETSDAAAEEIIYYSHKPNIVVVQLESFFNINRLKDVTFDKNPLPNLTALMDMYPSGLLNVPVVGAGTVNSEFEVLTGMNIDDFGIGEYPYKTIVKEQPCESLAYNLKPYGYKTFAIHNNTGDFYERNQVYTHLGFDTFTSVEYMWPTDYTPMDWCKDNILVSQIQTALDSTSSQDFVYTVSVQGHGSYPSDSDLDYEKHVHIVDSTIEDQEQLNRITYYANQLYEMDQFIFDLLQMLRSRKEPTILLMYGDHLPSLDLTDDDLSYGNLYQTEYFIWNNAGLSFDKGEKEAFTLSSTLLHSLDILEGGINSYHQTALAEMQDGKMTEEEYLMELKELEYDILYGDNVYYGGINPYHETELTMGFFPILIKNAEVTKDHVLILTGENFTRYSKILINDSEVTTLYLDPETLVAADVTLTSGDVLQVAQSSLSKTEEYIYP